MPNNETTTKFKADISQLKTAMQQAQREVKLANAQFKAAASSMDDWSKSSDGLSAKLKQLNTVQNAQVKQLNLLKNELDLTVKQYGENSKEADNLRIRIENQKAALNNTTKEIDQYTKELDECGKETDQLGDESKETEKQVGNLSDGFTITKGALADLVASGIKAAISELKDLAGAAKEAYQEFDAGADAVIKATGATGDAAKELEKSYNTVAHNVIGDMGDIGSALGEVNTRFGFTGSELEEATESFLKFSDITGTDAVDSVRLVSRAIENSGMEAKDYTKLLDVLAKAGQTTGVSVSNLAESVTKNGATLRQLGYTTEESVAMLAQFEKEGVNTETVLAGMKKAVANWGKEGKNAKLEYKAVLEEIKNTADVTRASELAIETFGSKAGPELVEDIQAGKLEYQDFLDVLTDSTGTVEKTYEATQDGFDKVSLAIQGGKADLGAFVRDLATEYQDEIVSFIDKLKKWIKNAIAWVIRNGKIIIETIKSIAKVMATLWTVKKVSQFAQAINGVIGAIKGMSAATSALNGVTSTLSALVSPGGAIVLGIAAIATVTATIINLTKEEKKEVSALTDEQKEHIQASKDLADAYHNLETERQTSMQSVGDEYNRYGDLMGRLDELVAANGRVQTGKEQEVQFILNELNQALGTEMQLVNGVVQNYQNERDAIQEVLEKKRAEAILVANQDAYTEAYMKRRDAAQQLTIAEADFNEVVTKANEKQKEVNEINAEYNRILEGTSDWYGRTGIEAAQDYMYANQQIVDELEPLKKAVTDTRQSLVEATTAYEGYNQIVQNYEGLSSAIVTGDMDAINDALIRTENNLKTHGVTTTDVLKEQADKYDKYYNDLLKASKEGNSKITKEQIEEAKRLRDITWSEYLQGGTQATRGYAKGVEDTLDEVAKAGDSIGDTSVDSLEDSLDAHSPSRRTEKSGEYFAQGFINGMDNKSSAVYLKAKALAEKAIQGLKDGQKEGSPSKITTQSGKYFTEGYMNGIGSEEKALIKEVKDLVFEAIDALGGTEVIRQMKRSITDQISGSELSFGNIGGIRAAVPQPGPTTSASGRGNTVTNTYNLVQNNTSPKALTALETYQARRQQVAMLKAMM